MRKLQTNYMYFTIFALSVRVLVLPERTEGLSCFSCNSKIDEGCKNEDLKNGYRNNMFSEKCLGSDAICVKQSAVVKNYYEEHYSKPEMDKYYAAIDAAAKCRGIGVLAGSAVTSAPSGDATITSFGGGPPGGTAAAGSGAGDSDGGGATGTTPEAPAGAVTEATGEEEGTRRRRAVAANCPAYPKSFPEHKALVQRNDERWVYSCGNRSEWHAGGVVNCHTYSDGILARTICVCGEDLCNRATVQGAVPFLVLAAALLHLQGVVG